ncbi:ADP-ribosylglycohydrolase family protein [Kribbella sp. NPDC050124]|uniref:ADP-ribosylglycohydrolase family protein n=1 Tax=Kribbella sp. NPDC050124 TaxID=3364114 RepID=UPI00379B8D47
MRLDIASAEYYDRVYGCWQGKNAGGTLGTPLEEAYGRDEPFDVWWYPELAEGGLPNDDLEMQLAWLLALEEVGPTLTARDLARYWLDHIGYNFDEYGLSKGNLRLGLEPPVSGWHNNWFVDCMGSPIRSEIWACCAPGAPRVATRLAIQDAICDHAGGEGVYGEVFNAAVESSAFVVQNPTTLIDIGLSYLPSGSASARAVRAVLEAHSAGLDWRQAREAVRKATPHYVAQYSPINLGFQVIGLLYGTDFGDGICKTVNCGYDTDSSGAAIGSYLGLIYGSRALPERWVAPLGDTIATNESWGGVKNLSAIPRTLDELATRIRRVADRVLRHHGLLDASGVLTTTLADLYADPGFAGDLAATSRTTAYPGRDLNVVIDYGNSPVIHADTARPVVTVLTNPRAEEVEVSAALATPDGWPAPEPRRIRLAPGATTSLTWQLGPVRRGLIGNSNRMRLDLSLIGRPTPQPVPFVLTGGHVHRVSEFYPHPGGTDAEALDTPLPPESGADARSRPGKWIERSVDGYDTQLAAMVTEPGIAYLQTFYHAPEDREVWLAVDANSLIKVWLNGVETHRTREVTPIRPNLSGSPGSAFVAGLRKGWNELLVKVVRGVSVPSLDLFLGLSSHTKLKDAQPDIGRTRYPWDAPER